MKSLRHRIRDAAHRQEIPQQVIEKDYVRCFRLIKNWSFAAGTVLASGITTTCGEFSTNSAMGWTVT
jgi:hypothetical protein